MSVKAMTWVFEHSPLRGKERLVHLAIADVANDDHDNRVWLKQEAIAHKARCSVDTVARAIHGMLDLGLLELIEKGGGRARPDVFRFVMKTPHVAEVSQITPQQRGENPANSTPVPLINSNELKGQNPRIFELPVSEDLPVHVAELRARLTHPTHREEHTP